ncbi:MAG: hypothetical protein PHZ27_05365, partial [Candidatus Omnitrophica bacterium]|nr:hypothetical protein [Candidatus Omnitrophota bacterium]
MKKSSIENKKWITPEIIRIKLSPEQAILSCCNITNRGPVGGPGSLTTIQCRSSLCLLTYQ